MVILVAEVFRYSFKRIKRVNQKLIEERERADLATKRKDVFMAKMSHELRTPLNGIMGITDLIIDSEECKQKGVYLGMIKEAAETLKYLIDDLLDLSKIENDLITLNNRHFRLKTFLECIVQEFELQSKKKNISIISDTSDRLDFVVFMDSHRLRQIFSNLISNAIKYTDAGGEVTFAAEFVSGEGGKCGISVKVSDNGIGIAQEDLDMIFNSFYRSIDTYNNQSSGIGLGLYIVDRLVELFNGTISVSSEHGEGSCFTVSMPLVPDFSDKTGPIETDKDICANTSLNILIAEDNRINAVFITTLLEKEGHVITLVDNGEDAALSACETVFDLILMDIQMPRLSGIDALQQIRNHEKEANVDPVAIVAITAYASDNEQLEILKAGFDYYLTKPFDSAKLQQTIRSVIESLKK
jgi:CheY-like chemotaxis protein